MLSLPLPLCTGTARPIPESPADPPAPLPGSLHSCWATSTSSLQPLTEHLQVQNLTYPTAPTTLFPASSTCSSCSIGHRVSLFVGVISVYRGSAGNLGQTILLLHENGDKSMAHNHRWKAHCGLNKEVRHVCGNRDQSCAQGSEQEMNREEAKRIN